MIKNTKIKNLNGLHRGNRRGVYKIAIAKNMSSHRKICHLLEKINYAIQDIEIELKREFTNSSLVSILTYTYWICDAVLGLKNCYKKEYMRNFNEFNSNEYRRIDKYFRAIRSLILAHPFHTTQHPEFGLNGTITCIDIQTTKQDVHNLIFLKDHVLHFDIDNGIVEGSILDADFVIHIYNENKYNNKYEDFVELSINQICDIANYYIDVIYKLDKYLYDIKTR